MSLGTIILPTQEPWTSHLTFLGLSFFVLKESIFVLKHLEYHSVLVRI